jgi:hypothetical protein
MHEQEKALNQVNVVSFIENGLRTFTTANPSLKHNSHHFLNPPCLWRGFVWSDSSNNKISPAAYYTEIAPPLSSPPQHLLDDPQLQASIKSLGNAIKVDTPFDIDKLELLLSDHPNQPFVHSVMKGFHEGFWPFDEGEWKIEVEEVMKTILPMI